MKKILSDYISDTMEEQSVEKHTVLENKEIDQEHLFNILNFCKPFNFQSTHLKAPLERKFQKDANF